MAFPHTVFSDQRPNSSIRSRIQTPWSLLGPVLRLPLTDQQTNGASQSGPHSTAFAPKTQLSGVYNSLGSNIPGQSLQQRSGETPPMAPQDNQRKATSRNPTTAQRDQDLHLVHHPKEGAAHSSPSHPQHPHDFHNLPAKKQVDICTIHIWRESKGFFHFYNNSMEY